MSDIGGPSFVDDDMSLDTNTVVMNNIDGDSEFDVLLARSDELQNTEKKKKKSLGTPPDERRIIE